MTQFRLPKPKFGDACNGCGYCCTAQPCALAEEFLNCKTGPCIALEEQNGRTICGLVRNPLGYLFQAAHPNAEVSDIESPPASAAGRQLSEQIAEALGVGKGCDADDVGSEAWSAPA